MLPKVKIDLTPIAKATGEGISLANKGVAKVANALAGRWIAERERAVDLLRAQTEKDADDIKCGRKRLQDGVLVETVEIQQDGSFFETLHKLNHQADSQRLQAALEEAFKQFQHISDDEISDEPLSSDFFNRWRREAEMIDEQSVRSWWAKLLVEESKKPNSISPRTLDVARNLSKSEAELFLRIAKSALDGAIIVNKKGHPPSGTYSDILLLQDAGLIGNQLSSRTMTAMTGVGIEKPYVFLPTANRNVAILVQCEQIQLSCNLLTKAGIELLNLFPVEQTIQDIIGLATTIHSQAENHSVSVTPAVPGDKPGSLVFSPLTDPLWESKSK